MQPFRLKGIELGTRTLLGAPGLTTRLGARMLLGAPGIATRNKDATSSSQRSLIMSTTHLEGNSLALHLVKSIVINIQFF